MEVGFFGKACEIAGVHRQTVWQERKKNFQFAAAEDEAIQMATRLLEDEAVRRARDGIRKVPFNPRTGEPYVDPATGEVYVEHQYSDALLIRLLAARLPKIYGAKVELETEVRHRRLTLEELKLRMAEAEA